MSGVVVRRVLALVGVTGAATVSLDLATVVVAIGAFGTAIYNFYRVRQARPVVSAELEDRAVTRLRAALDEYAQDNARLRAEVATFERVERELRLEVRACRARIDEQRGEAEDLRRQVQYLTEVVKRAGLNGP